jgi:hypothetical protein
VALALVLFDLVRAGIRTFRVFDAGPIPDSSERRTEIQKRIAFQFRGSDVPDDASVSRLDTTRCQDKLAAILPLFRQSVFPTARPDGRMTIDSMLWFAAGP